MQVGSGPTFDLVDPRPIASRAPYTFFLPDAAEIAAVGIGDLVKLIFEYPHDVDEWGAERMWVIVTGVDGDTLSGSLDNEPAEPTTTLQIGASIQFRRHHIISIQWAKPLAAPSPCERQQYWTRCIVDACVLDGEEPVEFLYREEPDMAVKAGEYPDSGWRIRGRAGDATEEEVNARKAEYVALGAVLNQDDSWLSLIDSPVGSAFVRDFTTSCYVPEARDG